MRPTRRTLFIAALGLVLAELIKLSTHLRERGEAAPKEEAKVFKTAARRLQNRTMLTNVESLLEIDERITALAEDFDTDPWLLNTPAGTVDLSNGEMIEPDPKAMCSKVTAVAPASGDASVWFRFLHEATGGDKALQRFVQKQVGYALTGDMSEQTLSFVWGQSTTGKTTFIEAIAGMFGSYSVEAAMETFVASGGSAGHPTDLAGLVGARLVTSEETQAGRRWDEQRIKKITGGGRIRVRFMRQDFFEYRPTYKLMVIGNHEPEIGTVDDAMRRRIHIVPFVHKPDEIDRHLGAKIEQEWPQILTWAIEGCLLWQKEGLDPPEVVLTRTEQYFDEEDPLQQWLDERCRMEEAALVSRMDLYRSWVQWCHAHGEEPGGAKTFKRRMDPKKALGFSEWQVGEARVKGYKGIRLTSPNEEIGDEFS